MNYVLSEGSKRMEEVEEVMEAREVGGSKRSKRSKRSDGSDGSGGEGWVMVMRVMVRRSIPARKIRKSQERWWEPRQNGVR
jgi:hypothetical protein